MQITTQPNGAETIHIGGDASFPAIGYPGIDGIPPAAGRLVYCPVNRLKTHPLNMRRYYPPEDVAEMAASIRANKGVLQALLVILEGDSYLVVDGNMRLAGARVLGQDCPPLKCEIIEATLAQQLLIMATTSKMHYPKDAISEGLHYQRLMDEGYSKREIAAHTGINENTVAARLKLLELDEPIRQLVASGKLPKDRAIAEAILNIPDSKVRVALAERLAADPKTTVKSACAVAARLSEQITGAAVKKPVLKLDPALFTRFAGNVIVELERDAIILEQCANTLLDYGEYAQAEIALSRARKNRRLRRIALRQEQPGAAQ